MKFSAALLAGTLLASSPAEAVLSIDGTPATSSTATFNVTVSASDGIIIIFSNFEALSSPVYDQLVPTAPGLTFAQRASIRGSGPDSVGTTTFDDVRVFWARYSSAGTYAVTINANCIPTGCQFDSGFYLGFGVTGFDGGCSVTPFDATAASAVGSNATAGVWSATQTTTDTQTPTTNEMLLMFLMNVTVSGTWSSGTFNSVAATFVGGSVGGSGTKNVSVNAQSRNVSAAQTAITNTIAIGSSLTNHGYTIVDALRQSCGAGGGGGKTSELMLMGIQ